MLTQGDVVRLFTKPEPPPQQIAFSILHAYTWSKARRGNLPSEIVGKLLSIIRKLHQKGGHALQPNSPILAAFAAIKTQLMAANRKWLQMGAQAFGPLGAIGATGGHPDAKWAWTKATDGLVKDFPDGDGSGAMGWVPGELDAGRIIGPEFTDTADPFTSLYRNGQIPPTDVDPNAPPGYDGPPQPDDEVVQALNERIRDDAAGVQTANRDSIDEDALRHRLGGSTSPSPPRDHIDEGAAHLARLRQLKEEKEAEEAAREASGAKA
ncbi:hypothetical protein Rt10032_c07g3262 [Rhodotorula toruloides]|uniref:Uncharacterized protein n=1 Tax=Rhodotorula toruloides TaxID=5286 RepID=A0A511KH46_RHOTO|nr:hypothetical protein Rt10032_c07g3262 [Rhodotorula toruloides]